MHTQQKLLLVFLLALTPSFAWGGDVSVSDYVAQQWTRIFSDQNTQAPPKQTILPLYQTQLTPTFFTPPVGSSRLRDLAPETDQARTRGLLSSTSWLNGNFITETEVAQSLGGTGWLQGRIPGDSRGDASQRMVRLSAAGTMGPIRYGVQSRSAGQAFFNVPDQAMREVWGEWKTGWTTLRSAIGQQWNNVAGDATRSRLEQTYERISLAWKRPTWPEATMTYARNTLNSALDPLNINPQRSQNHTLEGALAYNSIKWNARLASSYLFGSDLLHGGAETTTRIQVFTAAFRPMNTLTITPTLGYREDAQSWTGLRISSPSASVALQYQHNQQLLLRAMGNYAGIRSSDGLIDTEQMGGKGILMWDLQQSRTWTTLVSFEAGYNRMANHVTPSADTEDISGVIRLVVAVL